MKLLALNARAHGPLVLALGDYSVEGSIGMGKDISSHIRFTALWKQERGVWRSTPRRSGRETVRTPV
jgi:hypothetical protein